MSTSQKYVDRHGDAESTGSSCRLNMEQSPFLQLWLYFTFDFDCPTMATIYPRPNCHETCGSQELDGSTITNSNRSYSVRTLTKVRTSGWQNALPSPNIQKFISLSKLRCFITLISLALLVTDIPRTGLGVRTLLDYYQVPLMPSTAIRFGPAEYPITHIRRLKSSTNDVNTSYNYVGLKGNESMTAVRAWPYQHDTISIGLRGAVQLLNVSEYPEVLLYKSGQDEPATNPDTLISLDTIFTMIDSFMTAVHSELLGKDNSYSTLRFATQHNWIDRLHHYVVRFASKNPAWRLHSLHVARISSKSQSFAICSNTGMAKRSLKPRFCNHPGIWKHQHPLNASLPAVRLQDHMNLRLQSLKQRYSDLELDVVLLSSQRLSKTSGMMRSTYYNYEAQEIALLIRGRRCVEEETGDLSLQSKAKTCTTIFVDDHRYERDIVQTNVIDWYGIISMLRGGSQTYVWIRLVLLGYGASVAAKRMIQGKSKPKSQSVFKLIMTIIFRIPFEVIVYSSLLPVTGYVVALVLDGSFADIFLDAYWTVVGGTIDIGLVSFLRTTAVQMRNVWLLALLVNLAVFAMKKTRGHWTDGTPGIRGLVISFTSMLTVCGPYKTTMYRDTDIITVFRLAHESKTMDIIHTNSVGHINVSTYIFDDSVIMLLFCIIVVIGLAMVVKCFEFVVRKNWTRHDNSGIILSSTPIVPCGSDRLWLASTLSIRFLVVPRPSLIQRSSTIKSPQEFLEMQGRPFRSQILPSTPSFTIGSPKDLGNGVQRSSAQFQSILQLMNIAMMTDPWNFFWLRVIGIQLYLYEIQASPVANSRMGSRSRIVSFAAILPFAEDEMEEYTGVSSEDFQLLDSANSRDVPLSVLFQSG